MTQRQQYQSPWGGHLDLCEHRHGSRHRFELQRKESIQMHYIHVSCRYGTHLLAGTNPLDLASLRCKGAKRRSVKSTTKSHTVEEDETNVGDVDLASSPTSTHATSKSATKSAASWWTAFETAPTSCGWTCEARFSLAVL